MTLSANTKSAFFLNFRIIWSERRDASTSYRRHNGEETNALARFVT